MDKLNNDAAESVNAESVNVGNGESVNAEVGNVNDGTADNGTADNGKADSEGTADKGRVDDAAAREALFTWAKNKRAGESAALTRLLKVAPEKRTAAQQHDIAEKTAFIAKVTAMFPALAEVKSAGAAWKMPTTTDKAQSSYTASFAAISKLLNKGGKESDAEVVALRQRLTAIQQAFPSVGVKAKPSLDSTLDAMEAALAKLNTPAPVNAPVATDNPAMSAAIMSAVTVAPEGKLVKGKGKVA